MRCIIGIDFDNTLLNYDDVFWKTSQRLGFLSCGDGVERHKRNIRDAIRQLPDGEEKWHQVQAYVYGKAIDEAVLIDGVQAFLQMCHRFSVLVYVISHKTRFTVYGAEKVDLLQAALNWMARKGFFEPNGLGFTVDHVFFEATRQNKARRIKQLGCTHFIDELEEIFLEESFPQDTSRILYSPHLWNSSVPNVIIFRTWAAIQGYFMNKQDKCLKIDS